LSLENLNLTNNNNIDVEIDNNNNDIIINNTYNNNDNNLYNENNYIDFETIINSPEHGVDVVFYFPKSENEVQALNSKIFNQKHLYDLTIELTISHEKITSTTTTKNDSSRKNSIKHNSKKKIIKFHLVNEIYDIQKGFLFYVAYYYYYYDYHYYDYYYIILFVWLFIT
jgi:hypothetical protein